MHLLSTKYSDKIMFGIDILYLNEFNNGIDVTT